MSKKLRTLNKIGNTRCLYCGKKRFKAIEEVMTCVCGKSLFGFVFNINPMRDEFSRNGKARKARYSREY